jgi:hypothetical protein
MTTLDELIFVLLRHELAALGCLLRVQLVVEAPFPHSSSGYVVGRSVL